jgi:hypothetical protein
MDGDACLRGQLGCETDLALPAGSRTVCGHSFDGARIHFKVSIDDRKDRKKKSSD